MKTTFVGHAAILVETKGLRILSDPWWQGPCFGAQWWIYPKPSLDAVDSAPVDYIYVSHGHADHLHLGTLRRFPNTTKVLVSDTLDLTPSLQRAGFEVIEVGQDEEIDLGNGVKCRIIPTYADDTLMVLSDGEEVSMNLNDALHASPGYIQDSIIARLKQLYPKVDYVFCGYGIASHFPNCYVIPGKDNAKTAIERQKHFNRQWARIVNDLEPTFGFPFAADVAFLEQDLFWANEPTHNGERPTNIYPELYPDSKTEVFDIGPGFTIEDGKVTDDTQFHYVRESDLQSLYEREIVKVNKHQAVDADFVDYLREELTKRVEICRPYLVEYSGDYRFLVVIRGAANAIEIAKKGKDITLSTRDLAGLDRKSYDVILTTQSSYLRRTLASDFGHETLFVGSGCIFEYTTREKAEQNLHRELLPLLNNRTQPPRSRFGDQSKLMYQLKQGVKKVIGRVDEDLYDLKRWTVFN